MTPNAYESWAIANAMRGRFEGIEPGRLAPPVQRLVDRLEMNNVCRTSILQGWAIGQPEGPGPVLRAMVAANADDEPPGPEADERFPTPSITGIASEAQL
jgi:hypothetical protein